MGSHTSRADPSSALITSITDPVDVPRMTEAVLTELASLAEQMENHQGHVAALVKLNHRCNSALHAVSGRTHLCEPNRMLRRRTQHYLRLYSVEVESGNLLRKRGR